MPPPHPAAQKLLAEFKEKGSAAAIGTTDEDLWAARELIEARVHPDTGKPVPVLLCFAAYTPMQPPIILGLMWPNASVTNMLFWQVGVCGLNPCELRSTCTYFDQDMIGDRNLCMYGYSMVKFYVESYGDPHWTSFPSSFRVVLSI